MCNALCLTHFLVMVEASQQTFGVFLSIFADETRVPEELKNVPRVMELVKVLGIYLISCLLSA